MKDHGVLDHVDAVAVHGFPLDWNLWQIQEWPQKIDEIRRVTDLPVWVCEVGVSTFGAEEVQAWGLKRTAELLIGRRRTFTGTASRSAATPGRRTTRHREAEGSSYYRHFYMGLLREDGSPKPALGAFSRFTPELGICQWFHFEDHRLDDAVRWMRRLGVKYLRTGLSWADSFRPNALDWFDRQMEALADFDLTVTFCFTPEHRGLVPHHTSPPLSAGRICGILRHDDAALCRLGAAAPRRAQGRARRLGDQDGRASCRRPRRFTASLPTDAVRRYRGRVSRIPMTRRSASAVISPLRACVAIAHITDGAPRSLHDARRYGFSTWQAYAEARRSELADAVRLPASTAPSCWSYPLPIRMPPGKCRKLPAAWWPSLRSTRRVSRSPIRSKAAIRITTRPPFPSMPPAGF